MKNVIIATVELLIHIRQDFLWKINTLDTELKKSTNSEQVQNLINSLLILRKISSCQGRPDDVLLLVFPVLLFAL